MKPNFALNLSHEGISLLHRATAGWSRVGDVALDDPDLNDHLRLLRKTAIDLESGGLTSKLVIPNSQVLYTEIEAPGPGTAARISQIRDGLVGLTPYDVSDLVFDWRLFGSKAQVAVVARETLTEAEAFASEFRFNPVCFVAVPMNGTFEGEPYFGPTKHAASLLQDDETIEPDIERMEVLGAGQPAKAGKAKPEAAAKAETTSKVGKANGASPAAEKTDDASMPSPAAERKTTSNVPDKPESPKAKADTEPKPAARPKPKAKPEPEEPQTAGDGVDDLGPMPVTFSTRREASTPPLAPQRAAPPPLEPVTASNARTEPKISPQFSHSTALDIDDVPEMPAWRTVSGGAAVTPMAVTAAHTADPIPEGAPAPNRNTERRAAAATARNAALAASTAMAGGLAGGLGKLGKGTATRVRRMRARKTATAVSATEADSMTVFGARGTGNVGGKPRYLGLILTLLLLLALAILALWSTFFLGDGGNRALVDPDEPTEISAVDPIQPTDDPIVSAVPLDPVAPEASEAPASPTVLAIDSAVEDALTVALSDTGPETEAETDTGDGTVAPDAADLELALLPDPTADVTDSPPPDRITQPPPTRAEAEASYAVTGVWSLDPGPLPDVTGGDRLEGLALATIDTTVTSQTAVELPDANALGGDIRPPTLTPPAELGIRYDLDARGLVRATPEGAISPDGTLVIAGLPAVVPPPRPGTEPPVLPVLPAPETPIAETLQPESPETGITSETTPEINADEPSPETVEVTPAAPDVPELDPEQERLREIRPTPRPDRQQGTNEQPGLGGFSQSELAAIRPPVRPLSQQEESTTVALAEPDVTELADEPEIDLAVLLDNPTQLAVEASLQPAGRPSDFADTVQKALAEANASPSNSTPEREVAAAVVPSIPSRASVANQATEQNAINLGTINLIGVYGSPTDRRALVRLKTGRYIKVEVGDSVDGGRVAAIGDDELRYVKRGKNITLKMPSG